MSWREKWRVIISSVVCARGWETCPRLCLWMSQKQSVGMPTDFSPWLMWGREALPSPWSCCDAASASISWKTPLLNTQGWSQWTCRIHNTVPCWSRQRVFLYHFLRPELMLWLTNWSPLTSQPTHWCCYQRLRGATHPSCSNRLFSNYFFLVQNFFCKKTHLHLEDAFIHRNLQVIDKVSKQGLGVLLIDTSTCCPARTTHSSVYGRLSYQLS